MNWSQLLLVAPAPNLIGFGILALAPIRFGRHRAALIGTLAGSAPVLVLLPVILRCLAGSCPSPDVVPIMTVAFGTTEIALALSADPLSLVAAGTVATVGALVLIYASSYMLDHRGSDMRRFYALMNLFIAGMLSVVLAGDSIVFFLGWEIIGLCSFFLIGFETQSWHALFGARKAFVMTRIADAALLAGLLLLFLEAGSVRFGDLIPAGVAMDDRRRAIVTALLLVGALGKSAQLPFQTWLPSAMVGPTPVSALLHSATMVAAGAFLLARFAPVFAEAPTVASLTVGVGLATAAFGALCAFAQTDAKKLLAYSSISQIGFMVLALGYGAVGAGMAHFVIHAAFKSLLFLSVGAITHAGHGSTAMDALEGALKTNTIPAVTLIAGAASLAGLPLVSAGWYSKEAVLMAAWEAGLGGKVVWLTAIGAAVITGAYAMRLVLAVSRPSPDGRGYGEETPMAMRAPLMVLAGLALIGGFAVGPILAALGAHHGHGAVFPMLIGGLAPLLGGALAVIAAMPGDDYLHTPFMLEARRGFRFDARYQAFVVRPFRRFKRRIAQPETTGLLPERTDRGRPGALARIERGLSRPEELVPAAAKRSGLGEADVIGRLTTDLGAWITRIATRLVAPDYINKAGDAGGRTIGDLAARSRRLQTGRLRDYLLALALGLVLLLLTMGVT